MRLDKVLANRNFGSRSEVKSIIGSGKVLVNNEVITSPKAHISENTYIICDGEEFVYNEFEYLMLYKPSGYVCANIDNVYPTVFELLPSYYHKNFHVIGRLDVDTTGLVLITNDGKFTHQVISPQHNVGKTYLVETVNKIEDNYKELFYNGIELEDYKCMSADFKYIDEYYCELIIYEGKFHQVKKMFIALHNEVKSLHRLKIGDLTLEDLELGEYKLLNEKQRSLIKGDKK